MLEGSGMAHPRAAQSGTQLESARPQFKLYRYPRTARTQRVVKSVAKDTRPLNKTGNEPAPPMDAPFAEHARHDTAKHPARRKNRPRPSIHRTARRAAADAFR